MNILVCIKPVPDPEKYGQLKIDEKTKRLVREGIPAVINPADKNALEEGIKLRDLKGGRVFVLAMAPEFSRDKLIEALAMGADEAYLVSDKAFGGADTYATSYVLAAAIKKISQGIDPQRDLAFDLVLAGNESADGATAHVPAQTAEWLGLPHLCKVSRLEAGDESENAFRAWKRVEAGKAVFQVNGPCVIAVSTEINKPRLINAMGIIKAKKKPLTIWSNEDLRLDEKTIGLAGSPTQPGELITPDLRRASIDLGSDAEAAADEIVKIMKKAGV
ncbi:electron transfer flavoprotein subunit beta/FixA family protein [Anaerovorax odorimutans]|uniref:Electron transfer flavoprotein small subunit n=1 Tax=Anaerovorax odorimutans TaxID=109327 RepID=A0ABT1RMQ4_9FIRM|nr:electron transfer flavoprotein subunit beta/FixA family protein [Anaerovorax odorimutans]MCQ4636450.1 electron transfer flavoprotein subunit beta/FixA family protein [Anaerovorax odorimutans]